MVPALDQRWRGGPYGRSKIFFGRNGRRKHMLGLRPEPTVCVSANRCRVNVSQKQEMSAASSSSGRAELPECATMMVSNFRRHEKDVRDNVLQDDLVGFR